MKTTVVYHRADFDGLFCREIAKKFLPDAELIGWDFGDAPLSIKTEQLYVLDLPLDRPFGFTFEGLNMVNDENVRGRGYRFGNTTAQNVVWIDHHKTSIESHPEDIPGYRIDGVAACRLAWQWFASDHDEIERRRGDKAVYSCVKLPTKEQFVNREVSEPYAVRLAGEYDIWDKRDPDAELFQHGLKSRDLTHDWGSLLRLDEKLSISAIETLVDVGHQNLCRPDGTTPNPTVLSLLSSGRVLQYARAQEYREVILEQGFDVTLEGYRYLACNSHELDIRSQLFEAGIKPEHDGLLGFTFNGKDWRVSLYHVPHKTDIDHSVIAKKYGGGGHKGACGFRVKTLPFPL